MGNWWSREECKCCEWQYSKRKYSKIGELCNPCEKYYSSQVKGKVDEKHDNSVKTLDQHPWDSKRCECCELYYNNGDVMTAKFECRNRDHVLEFCINCGALQASNDSLTCPFPMPERNNRKCNAQPRQSDLSAAAEKRKKHGKVTPVGK